MRNTGRIVATGLLAVAAAAGASAGDQAGAAAAQSPSRPALLAPNAGQALRAGSEVTVEWHAQLPACARNFFGEQEVMLSVDGGRTFPYRITPRLSYEDRTFTWRVPNMPTAEAVLDLRYGCENEPGECEPYRTVVDAQNPQMDSRFRIVASPQDYVHPPSVYVGKTSYVGDTVGLKWDARVSGLDHFEVLASIDRGGAFETVATTRENTLRWSLPADGLRCSYFFKVVAVKTDGSRIESAVDTTQMVYVTPRR